MSFLRVLGVDPGYGRTGLGVVDVTGGDATWVWHSVIDTSPESAFVERLAAVRNDVREAIRRFSPTVACVESLFFQTNAKTAMKVGMARGVIMLALADAGLPIVEVTPNQVKQGIAGWGNADKKQVQAMVTRLLKLANPPKPDDAADALALAIVGGLVHRQSRSIG
ncbi:crossover junction endodeoxyribonuclease RuvC [Candidatus Uhrbacteria bacterium RIFCSPHIGHO2_12_FULL_60_25]|uniref:Crossover junction endodeoxyribonuclease RuvC n=1 Tax=Candidatus Uhrbacteria bacterium RIFCSPHIGHO2_12_FULL_60_25 TaxID=1802399 RepID=A0A1F7UQ01_9BACT|nr:MAG: crossover junction endodeoxyribonuclease RuvC [Candidatus Uhrbacteria bacterium RIFCSPHIGHO2_02_FULL_60_44]OGL79767.1 MAG: crossover junction endodeoxyribonuclease RuvC [Candidatus Uhrbacteria bacterium RIFCSPHIGHO2_12_FULL_60_25]